MSTELFNDREFDMIKKVPVPSNTVSPTTFNMTQENPNNLGEDKEKKGGNMTLSFAFMVLSTIGIGYCIFKANEDRWTSIKRSKTNCE